MPTGMRMRPVCEGINPLRDIVEGASHFQQAIAPEAREFFGSLAAGQAPKALFVTCSDSRINPFLITDTNPGDLFIMRNAGHIVPPYGAAKGAQKPRWSSRWWRWAWRTSSSAGIRTAARSAA